MTPISPGKLKMIRVVRPLLLPALLPAVAACTPPATVGAAADASVSADSAGSLALLNRDEALRAMDRDYDPLMRDAGVTGRVMVRATLQADGSVGDVDVLSSTNERFTPSARQVARVLRFSSAEAPGAQVRVRMEFIYGQNILHVVRQ